MTALRLYLLEVVCAVFLLITVLLGKWWDKQYEASEAPNEGQQTP